MKTSKKLIVAAISIAASQAFGANKPSAAIPLNQDNVQWHRAVAIAGDGNGKFLQVWQDVEGQVWAQYSNASSMVGSPFKIGSGTGYWRAAQPDLSVDMNSTGDAVVAFSTYDDGPIVQRIPADSSSATSLPAPVIADLSVSDVAMDDSGNFAVAGQAFTEDKVKTDEYYVDPYTGDKYYYYDYVYSQKLAISRFDKDGNSLPVTANGASGDYYGLLDGACSVKTNNSVRKVKRNGGPYISYEYGNVYYDTGRTENLVFTDYYSSYSCYEYGNCETFTSRTLDDYSYSGDIRGEQLSLAESGSSDGSSCRPRIAMDGTGNAVATWANNGHVYARRYTPTGDLQDTAAPITVDRTPDDVFKWQTTGKGKGVSYIPVDPVVEMDSAGNFVVAWSLMKTRVKSFLPKSAEYEGHDPVIFKHELSASVMAQRFVNGAATHKVKGNAADAELVKETERVNQDLSITMTGSDSFAVAWANRFEDFKQFAQVGFTSSNPRNSDDKYLASIKGDVYMGRFTVDKNGSLKPQGGKFDIAEASKGTDDGENTFKAHWLPAIGGDSNGNITVMWQTQKHLDTHFTVPVDDGDGGTTTVFQIDRFDTMSRYYPDGSK